MIRVSAADVPNAGSFADALMLAARHAPRRPFVVQPKQASLSADDIAAIRRLYASNVWNAKSLARKYRVTIPQIQECLR